MLSDSRSLQEDSGSGPDQPAHAEWSSCVEEELPEPPEGKGRSRDLAAESKSCKLDSFVGYESVFSEALSDAQAVLKRLEECREIDASQKEVGVLTSINDASFFFTLLRAVIVCALFRKFFHGKLVPGCLKGSMCSPA